ncbi:MAG TPA: hypothetical protein ENN55_04970 [Firmicutes bacterium]|nr:hypothetical protein [Bacillota bacterium]
MKRIFMTAVLFMIMAAAALADTAVIAKAFADKQELTLGERMKYTISVSRKGSTSNSPRVSPPEFEGFRVAGSYSSSSINIVNNESSVTQNLQYELIAVKQGEITIHPAEVTFLNPEKNIYETIKTKPVTVKVTSGAAPARTGAGVQPTPTEIAVPPPVKSEFREIKFHLDLRLSDILPYVLLAFIFIATVVIIFRMVFKKKKRPSTDLLPADSKKEALKKIERAKKMLDKGEVKQYYFELYEAVRFYLGHRFNMSFDELTTREIVSALKKTGAAKEDTVIISEFLHECDVVKFADYKPKVREIEEMYLQAENIIEKI